MPAEKQIRQLRLCQLSVAYPLFITGISPIDRQFGINHIPPIATHAQHLLLAV